MQNEEKKPIEIFSREELKEVRGGDGTYYGPGGPGRCFGMYYDNGYSYETATERNCFENHDCLQYYPTPFPSQPPMNPEFRGWICKTSW